MLVKLCFVRFFYLTYILYRVCILHPLFTTDFYCYTAQWAKKVEKYVGWKPHVNLKLFNRNDEQGLCFCGFKSIILFFQIGLFFWFCLSQFCFLVIAVFWYIRENITSTKFSLILLSFELRNAFPGNNFSIFTVTNQDMLVPNLYPQPNVIGTVQGTQWVHSMPSSTYMYPVCITAVQWSYKKIHVRGRRESLAAERRGCLHVCCMCEWAVQNTMDRSSSMVQNSFTFVYVPL